MTITVLDQVVAGGAALVAGAVNAIAGGGTLVSFPALVAIGVPSLSANVTNTVALCPGYLSGTLAQRADLRPQWARVRRLAVFAVVGALAGSALLEVTPEKDFRVAVPYLILASCALLLIQDRVRGWVAARATAVASPARPAADDRPAEPAEVAPPGWVLCAAVLLASVYGGFFGAGLGIMLLAVLGVLCADSLVRLNAVKQALSLLINVVAAVFFAASGHVRWELVPTMAVASLIGGSAGGRLVQVIKPIILRRAIVVFGVAVAVSFFVT
jgi:hypothetical protein